MNTSFDYDSFFTKVKGKFQCISFDDVLYIEAHKNYSQIFTKKAKIFVHLTMKNLEEKLPDHRFCRIHRSYIVAIKRIKAFDHEFVYLDNRDLPLSGTYFEHLTKNLMVVSNDGYQSEEIENKKDIDDNQKSRNKKKG